MNRLFSTSSSPQDEATSGGVAVTSPDQSGKESELFPKKRGNRQLWRNNNHHLVPSLWVLSIRARKCIDASNREHKQSLRERGTFTAIRKVQRKERMLQTEVRNARTGKRRSEDHSRGVLRIRGEHKEAEDEEQQSWSSRYGYYDTRMVLPDDAKVEESLFQSQQQL
ncbi:hypothetical protein OROMI_021842 [Orobanche minor]